MRERLPKVGEVFAAIGIDDLAEGGISLIRGGLLTPDARAREQRLSALAATVCAHDPCTAEQRRADALGALAASADRLGCRCGRPDCAAGKRPAAGPVVIHVIAEQATLAGTATTPACEVGADGLIPPELIAELAGTAHLVPLIHPADAATGAGLCALQSLDRLRALSGSDLSPAGL